MYKSDGDALATKAKLGKKSLCKNIWNASILLLKMVLLTCSAPLTTAIFPWFSSIIFSSLPPLHIGQAELWYPAERPLSERGLTGPHGLQMTFGCLWDILEMIMEWLCDDIIVMKFKWLFPGCFNSSEVWIEVASILLVLDPKSTKKSVNSSWLVTPKRGRKLHTFVDKNFR